MSQLPSLLIAGCGDVGSRLGVRMAAQGWQVYGLRRDCTGLPATIQPLPGDLSSVTPPAAWPQQQLDYLVFAAAPGGQGEAGYRQVYVEGLRHLLGWLERGGQRPRRLLFVSSTGVYAQQAGEWVDEESPAEAQSFSGRVLLEAERLAGECGLASTVVRLAGLYGPGRNWLLGQVAEGCQVPAQPVLYGNRIHVDDAAGLLGCLLEADWRGVPLQSCYLGVDDAPAALAEVVQWLREQLGVSAVAGAGLIGRRGGSKRCSNARARALGWVPQYPSYREGYAALLAQRGLTR